MQSWTRLPTRCLICASRQARLAAKPPHNTRSFTSSTPSQRQPKSQTKKHKQDERPDNALKIRRTNDNHFRRSNNLSRDRVIDEIYHGLKAAKNRLDEEIIGSDKTKINTQLTTLDPDGTQWPAYREHILSMIEKSSSPTRSKKAGELWAKLSRAAGRDTGSSSAGGAVATELYFDFLDFCLRPLATNELGDSSAIVDVRYPTEWYLSARQSQRTIHLHVGPTNSGKTYNALKRLQEAKNGFYAGPLRLLAHEVYSRFRANGIPCDLVTGDDVRMDENPATKVYASTVEMVRTNQAVDVAVIDEIQMMGSEDRGWAWTRAFLGANAKEVHLCGETRVVPMIRELAASMGDALKIHRYERLNKLMVADSSLKGDLNALRKGDCVVAFSIMQLHALKKDIELKTGKRCAIVYGSLPPETRATQAELFNDPNNDYDFLVASDAIGMGLNLSVKRIIFHSVMKFDGVKDVELSVPQIKQIGGRAGRYRSAHQDKTGAKGDSDNVGIVTALYEMDMGPIRNAINKEPPPMKRAGIIPPAEYLEEYSARLPMAVPFEYLMRKVAGEATIHPRFFLCDIRDKLALSRATDEIPGLSIEQRVHITSAPANGRDPRVRKAFVAMAKVIAKGTAVTIADLKEVPFDVLSEAPRPAREYLEALETLHKCIILYLWLHYRFTANLRDLDMAVHAKEITEQKISWTLRAFSANPKLRAKLRSRQETSVFKHLDLTRNEPEPNVADGNQETELETQQSDEAEVEEYDDGSRFDQPRELGTAEADNVKSDEVVATPREEAVVEEAFEHPDVPIESQTDQRASAGAGI